MIWELTWEQWVLAYSLALPRLLAIFMFLPFFSKQVLTGLIRNGTMISLALILVPVVAMQVTASEPTTSQILWLVLKEVIVGVLIGYPLATMFWAIQGIGFYIDNQRGAAMASSVDPLSGSQTTPLGVLFSQAFTVYFFASGAFFSLMGVLYQSYVIWPVTAFFPVFNETMPLAYLGVLDALLWLIIMFSAPVIVAMFLSELALALISRFAPQLNVFFLAMPVKSAIGMFVLIVYLPVLFDSLISYNGGIAQTWQSLAELFQ